MNKKIIRIKNKKILNSFEKNITKLFYIFTIKSKIKNKI